MILICIPNACRLYSFCKFSFTSHFLTNTFFHIVLRWMQWWSGPNLFYNSQRLLLWLLSLLLILLLLFRMNMYFFSNKLRLMFVKLLKPFLCCISCKTIDVYMYDTCLRCYFLTHTHNTTNVLFLAFYSCTMLRHNVRNAFILWLANQWRYHAQQDRMVHTYTINIHIWNGDGASVLNYNFLLLFLLL